MFSIRGELFIYPTETEHSVSIFFRNEDMSNAQFRCNYIYTGSNKYFYYLEHLGGNADNLCLRC